MTEIWAAVGSSKSKRSRAAGREAARSAIAERGAPAVALVFATAGHMLDELLAGVGDVLGPLPLAGCVGAGVIAQQGADESSHAVSLMVLGGGRLRPRTLAARDAATDPRAAAGALAAALADDPPATVILFPDGLTVDCSSFLAELQARLPHTRLVGGSSGEMQRFERTHQFHDGDVLSGGVAALALGDEIEIATATTAECELLGIEHVVTRADGPLVYEFDGRPAWAVMRDYLDRPAEALGPESMPYLCIAHPLHDDGDFDGPIVVRAPLRLDPATGALFFPGSLPRGCRVMMARRDRTGMRAGTIRAAEALRARVVRDPVALLQIECASRGCVLFGDRTTEELIEPAQRTLGKSLPWIGFLSYGEIAPGVEGGAEPERAVYQNKAMVLAALMERR